MNPHINIERSEELRRAREFNEALKTFQEAVAQAHKAGLTIVLEIAGDRDVDRIVSNVAGIKGSAFMNLTRAPAAKNAAA